MRAFPILLAAMLLSAAMVNGLKAAAAPFNLAGTWSGPGGSPAIQITQNGNLMKAVLLQGTVYAPPGTVELTGNVTSRVFEAQQLCARYGHDLQWFNSTITILDSNHFTAAVHPPRYSYNCGHAVLHFVRAR